MESTLAHSARADYEEGIRLARERFAADSAMAAILHPQIEPDLLLLFLIYFSALGVGMTKPVVSWLERSGARCEAFGLPELGRAIGWHARNEAGHHRMIIEDTRQLVAEWNARHAPPLDADRLLAEPPTPGVLRYCKMHEDTIAGPTPYTQIAIQYEIEQLAVQYGPPLLDQCSRCLGAPILDRLSFLREHVELDVAHTACNEKHLSGLLREHPNWVRPLVRDGEEILDAYAAFLSDCLELARDAMPVPA